MVAKSAALWHSKAAARVYGPVCRFTLLGCGCSSGVEHNLAKVGVEGSNPFARSKIFICIQRACDRGQFDDPANTHRTEREEAHLMRGKSGEFVHPLFVLPPSHCA